MTVDDKCVQGDRCSACREVTEKVQSFPGITNYVEKIPGTTVTCYMGVKDSEPTVWIYTLWTNPEDPSNPEDLIAVSSIDFKDMPDVTPQQVARAAFLLEVTYKNA